MEKSLGRQDGTARAETISDPRRIMAVYLDLVRQANKEIMLLVPSANSFHRQEKLGTFQLLTEAASERGLRVRVLTAMDSRIEKMTSVEAWKSPVQVHQIPPAMSDRSVMILVADRRDSFIIEKEDDSKLDFLSAEGVATHSTGEATVGAYILLFEMLWNASELLENEARSRNLVQAGALRTPLAWEITPAKFNCASCGRQVKSEIRIYEPREMPKQSAAASAAMKNSNAGWIPFCYDCISSHAYLKPIWLVDDNT